MTQIVKIILTYRHKVYIYMFDRHLEENGERFDDRAEVSAEQIKLDLMSLIRSKKQRAELVEGYRRNERLHVHKGLIS